MPKKDEYLTFEEAADRLGVGRTAIYHMIERGVLRKFKRNAGRPRSFVSADEVERMKEILPDEK